MKTKRKKLQGLLIIIVLLTIIGAFFMSQSYMGESQKKNHAHQYYQSLMQGQNSNDPEELIKDAKIKAATIYLVIYKRSCSRCQDYQQLVREKVESYKKEGATILVAEAPEKGGASSYPSWIKQFSLPHATTPVIIRYDVSANSPSEALAYTNFQVYSEQKESWIFEVNKPNE